ncbi:MAG: hypothetical protein NTV80_06735 [Verrucomicrobia bacterium]|nr:hypothetical protein [Verrucomicrobiota bacterium]
MSESDPLPNSNFQITLDELCKPASNCINTMNKNAHYLAALGATSQILIPIGFLVSQLRLQSAVSGMNLSNTADVEKLSSQINIVTSQMGASHDSYLWAIGFAMLTLIPFIFAITRLRYRRKWAFWFSCIYGACLMCLFPIGTPFGLFLLIYALLHRQQFMVSSSAPTA